MSKPMKKKKYQLPENMFPLGVRFRVNWLPEIEGEQQVLGETDVNARLITVVNTADTGRRWSTTYHEYTHAVLGLIGVDDVLEEACEGLEEVIVRAIETATEQFLLAHGEAWLEALKAQKEEV